MSSTDDGRLDITLPERLDFDGAYEATTSIFKLLRHASIKTYRVKKLRFNNLNYISPAAALVLASEVDKWNQRLKGRLKADVETWTADIKRLLCEMGYFELLGLPRPKEDYVPGDVVFLKFIRGKSGEGDIGKLAQQLRKNIQEIAGQTIRKTSLYEGLSEAITNVGQHAYPPAAMVRGKKQWWLSASFNKSRRELTVMFYDQGIGIPNTLPRASMYELFKDVFAKWSDSEKIKAAMEYGRSSVVKPERGKGLKQLLVFAQAYPEGSLSIYSQRGLYHVSYAPDGTPVELQRNYQSSVGGTLIVWSIRI